MTEPKTRFKKNDGSNYPAWIEAPLGTLITENLDPVPTPREGYRRVGIYCHAKGTFQEDVPADKVLDVDTMYRIHKDNLIVNITFAWEHAVAIVKPEDEGLLVSHRFPEYSLNDGQVPAFYKYLILRPYFKSQLSLASPGGAGRNRVLNKAQFKSIPVTVPCVEEQHKIADFLSSVDEVIVASEEEISNLETQKKAVIKKIFSREVRFKRGDGSDYPDWENYIVSDLFDKISRKNKGCINSNVITNSAEYGLIPQRAFFDKNIAVEGKTENYTIISEGDFVYNPRKSIHAPMGPFNCYRAKEDGIVSPLYSCLRPKGYVNSEYLLWYFQTDRWYEYVNEHGAQNGARHDRVGMTNDILMGIPIDAPSSLEEQHLIADFLSDFDEAIMAAKKELELWKELKKGLLQQMFV